MQRLFTLVQEKPTTVYPLFLNRIVNVTCSLFLKRGLCPSILGSRVSVVTLWCVGVLARVFVSGVRVSPR